MPLQGINQPTNQSSLAGIFDRVLKTRVPKQSHIQNYSEAVQLKGNAEKEAVKSAQRNIAALKLKPLSSMRAISLPKRAQGSLKENLIAEYGQDILMHIQKMEFQVDQDQFLCKHQISSEYRAKMIDWMSEVLNTFKTSDQTYFLSVNIMDRYFKQVNRELKSNELHLVGVVSMFIASKYEDVIPLLMKTVVSKIGHNKFSQLQIQEKEIEILQAIGFKIGAPTVKEHLDRYFEQISSIYKVSENFKLLCSYISKIACHNYNLMQIPTSKLAISILRIALKIQQKVEDVKEYQQIMHEVLNFQGISASEIKDCSQELLSYIQSYDKICPNFKNVKLQYAELLQCYSKKE